MRSESSIRSYLCFCLRTKLVVHEYMAVAVGGLGQNKFAFKLRAFRELGARCWRVHECTAMDPGLVGPELLAGALPAGPLTLLTPITRQGNQTV